MPLNDRILYERIQLGAMSLLSSAMTLAAVAMISFLFTLPSDEEIASLKQDTTRPNAHILD